MQVIQRQEDPTAKMISNVGDSYVEGLKTGHGIKLARLELQDKMKQTDNDIEKVKIQQQIADLDYLDKLGGLKGVAPEMKLKALINKYGKSGAMDILRKQGDMVAPFMMASGQDAPSIQDYSALANVKEKFPQANDQALMGAMGMPQGGGQSWEQLRDSVLNGGGGEQAPQGGQDTMPPGAMQTDARTGLPADINGNIIQQQAPQAPARSAAVSGMSLKDILGPPVDKVAMAAKMSEATKQGQENATKKMEATDIRDLNKASDYTGRLATTVELFNKNPNWKKSLGIPGSLNRVNALFSGKLGPMKAAIDSIGQGIQSYKLRMTGQAYSNKDYEVIKGLVPNEMDTSQAFFSKSYLAAETMANGYAREKALWQASGYDAKPLDVLIKQAQSFKEAAAKELSPKMIKQLQLQWQGYGLQSPDVAVQELPQSQGAPQGASQGQQIQLPDGTTITITGQ